MLTQGRVTIYNTAHQALAGVKYRSVRIVLDYLEDEKLVAVISQYEGKPVNIELGGRYVIADMVAVGTALQHVREIAEAWAVESEEA